MKKTLMILLLLLILANTACIAADNGCRVDEYGCWVTDEEGNKIYIMFWSEPARKYIMGDLSEPGTALIDLPADLDIGMEMVNDPVPVPEIVEIFEDPFVDPFIPTLEPIPTVLPTVEPTSEPTPETASCIETAAWLKEKFGSLNDEIKYISTENEGDCVLSMEDTGECVSCIAQAAKADKSKWNTIYNSWEDFTGLGKVCYEACAADL